METITKRIDAIARIPVEYRREDPPCPKSVKIELTGRCNLRCKFCALAVRKEQPKRDMDIELFRRITAEMYRDGVREIGVFFIGESFMNPTLLRDAVAWLKHEVGMPYVFLTSQASLAKPEHLKAVMAAGVDSLKWSVNACDPEQFQQITGVSPKNMEAAQRNIKAAYELRNSHLFTTRLYASSIRYDDAQHDKMQAYLKEHVLPYVDEHYWLPLYSMGSLATEREERLGYRPSQGNRGRYDNPVDPLPCWSAFTEGHVLSDGRLSACCFDATGDWVMGDLTKQGFMEAWHSDVFRELRRKHLAKDVSSTKCAKCALYSPVV